MARPLRREFAVTNALSQVTTFTAYDGAGRLLSLVDANGIETDLVYNTRGWLTQTAVRGTNPSSTTDDVITGYAYDNTGQLKQLTQPDGSYFGFTWNAGHQLTDIVQKDVSNIVYGSIHYTLNAAGDRTQEDTKDPSGTVKRSVQRVFNTLGQLQIVANANANPLTNPTYTYSYDNNGNPTSLTDGRSIVTSNAVLLTPSTS